jgi:hypothetical protein
LGSINKATPRAAKYSSRMRDELLMGSLQLMNGDSLGREAIDRRHAEVMLRALLS